MVKINKTYLLFAIAIFLLFFALMAVGTKYDLQISMALTDLISGNYYSNNLFGRFFETIGEMPIYLIVAFASAVIFHNVSRREKNFVTLIVKIFAILVSVAMLYYMSYKIFKYLSQHYGFEDLIGSIEDYIAYALFGCSITGFLFYLTRNLPNKFLNKMLIWAITVWLTALLSQTITHSLKGIAARPRFRAMFVIQDFNIFRSWFDFQGSVPELKEDWVNFYGASKDWFKSFPSGHTSAAALLITLTTIPVLFEKTNKKNVKILLNISVYLFIFAVMLSRIIVGAHFLTDVTMGLFITVISFVASRVIVKIVFSKYKMQELPEKRLPRILEEAQ